MGPVQTRRDGRTTGRTSSSSCSSGNGRCRDRPATEGIGRQWAGHGDGVGRLRKQASKCGVGRV